MTRIIAVVGVSGVGKTTFLRNLARTLPFQHLSAGTLIGEEKALSISGADRDTLRLGHIADNQKLLVTAFRRAKNHAATLVVLDGHSVIHTPNGLEQIPADIFQQLGIEAFVFLKEDAAVIHTYRSLDTSRHRPAATVEEIYQHQNLALAATQAIASELCVPCYPTSAQDKTIRALFLPESSVS